MKLKWTCIHVNSIMPPHSCDILPPSFFYGTFKSLFSQFHSLIHHYILVSCPKFHISSAKWTFPVKRKIKKVIFYDWIMIPIQNKVNYLPFTSWSSKHVFNALCTMIMIATIKYGKVTNLLKIIKTNWTQFLIWFQNIILF